MKGQYASAENALVEVGMAPTLLERLARKVTGLEAAAVDCSQGRLDHVGARSVLGDGHSRAAGGSGRVDWINRWRYGKDPEVMREWESARCKSPVGLPVTRGPRQGGAGRVHAGGPVTSPAEEPTRGGRGLPTTARLQCGIRNAHVRCATYGSNDSRAA